MFRTLTLNEVDERRLHGAKLSDIQGEKYQNFDLWQGGPSLP